MLLFVFLGFTPLVFRARNQLELYQSHVFDYKFAKQNWYFLSRKSAKAGPSEWHGTLGCGEDLIGRHM